MDHFPPDEEAALRSEHRTVTLSIFDWCMVLGCIERVLDYQMAVNVSDVKEAEWRILNQLSRDGGGGLRIVRKN